MQTSFKPLYDFVLIEKVDAPNTTASGLVLTTSDDANTARFAPVVSVGDGYRVRDQEELLPLEVKVGDEVFFRPRSATEITLADKAYYLLRESEIMGIK